MGQFLFVGAKNGGHKGHQLKERNSIDDNFTTKYRKNTCDTTSESPKFKLYIEELCGK